MSSTPASGAAPQAGADDSAQAIGYAQRIGVQSGSVVMEIGYDDDADSALRDSIEELIGEDFVGEDSDEVADIVLLWFREDDGDLVDALVDAIGPLADTGVVWLMTPKRGQAGHVEPSDVAEAAPTAGLAQTSTLSVGTWTGTRLATPKSNIGRAKTSKR